MANDLKAASILVGGGALNASVSSGILPALEV
jgi:histidine ammonia-lyase